MHIRSQFISSRCVSQIVSSILFKEFIEVCHDSFKDVTFSNLYQIFDVLHTFCFSENVDTTQQHSRTYVNVSYIVEVRELHWICNTYLICYAKSDWIWSLDHMKSHKGFYFNWDYVYHLIDMKIIPTSYICTESKTTWLFSVSLIRLFVSSHISFVYQLPSKYSRESLCATKIGEVFKNKAEIASINPV